MQMYTLRYLPALFEDSPERLDFHIKTGDFLSYLATRLGFLEEAVSKCDVSEEERALAKELRNDLRYVHANYKVVPREDGDIQTVRPSGDLLAK